MSSFLLWHANLANAVSPTLLFCSVKHLTHKLVSLAKTFSIAHRSSYQFQTDIASPLLSGSRCLVDPVSLFVFDGCSYDRWHL